MFAEELLTLIIVINNATIYWTVCSCCHKRKKGDFREIRDCFKALWCWVSVVFSSKSHSIWIKTSVYQAMDKYRKTLKWRAVREKHSCWGQWPTIETLIVFLMVLMGIIMVTWGYLLVMCCLLLLYMLKSLNHNGIWPGIQYWTGLPGLCNKTSQKLIKNSPTYATSIPKIHLLQSMLCESQLENH